MGLKDYRIIVQDFEHDWESYFIVDVSDNCGGISGYYRLLEVLADPRDEEHEDMVEWLKGHAKNYFPYRPDVFDASAVKFWDPKKRWKMMMSDETHVTSASRPTAHLRFAAAEPQR